MQLSSKARKAVAIGLAASTIVWAGSIAALPLVASAAVHSDGCLVLSGGTVWLITNNSRRGFTSEAVFTTNGYNFLQVVAASSEDIALPVGPVMVYGEGTLLKGPSDPLVYLVVGGEKRPFVSGQVFTDLGFIFANVKEAPANTFADLPVGANITASTSSSSIPHSMVAPKTVACTTGSSSGSTTLNGGAGDATVTSTSTDVETSVAEGASNVKVLGFKVEASDSDIAVKSVKVSLQQTDSDGSNRLDHYVDSVSVYEGSNKVGSADASDFTKDGTTYSKSISLDSDAIVREGSGNKETFYVTVNALSNIDSLDLGASNNTWNIDAPSIRFMDAQGAIITDTTDPDSSFHFETIADQGDVTVTVSRGSSNPDTNTVEVSDTSTTKNVLLLEFKVKTVGSSMTFDTVDFDLSPVGDTSDSIASEFQLKKGSTTLATADAPSIADGDTGTLTFNLDTDETVDADSTSTYRVYATINDIDNFTEGDSLTVDWADFSDSLVDDNGDTFLDSDVDGSAAGNAQTFISTGAGVQFVSDHFTAEDASNSVDGTISLTFDVTAIGSDDVTIKEDQSTAATGAGDINWTLTGATQSGGTDGIVSCVDMTATGSPASFTITSGDTERCTLSVKFNSTAGFVQLQITNVDSTAVSNVKTQNF
ncbi:MAG TPA: hypothetical protein VL306_00425 [Methylomirabilota bacterium]|jgi:hypothetical protein|nr:hypothetical protein [Methylomirabilota bacterium]